MIALRYRSRKHKKYGYRNIGGLYGKTTMGGRLIRRKGFPYDDVPGSVVRAFVTLGVAGPNPLGKLIPITAAE